MRDLIRNTTPNIVQTELLSLKLVTNTPNSHYLVCFSFFPIPHFLPSLPSRNFATLLPHNTPKILFSNMWKIEKYMGNMFRFPLWWSSQTQCTNNITVQLIWYAVSRFVRVVPKMKLPRFYFTVLASVEIWDETTFCHQGCLSFKRCWINHSETYFLTNLACMLFKP
jgi:hypothetical protein